MTRYLKLENVLPRARSEPSEPEARPAEEDRGKSDEPSQETEEPAPRPRRRANL